MLPIAGMSPDAAGRIRAVLCDIDDTITTEGRLPGAAYQALEDLDAAGIAVVPITGRPAGWCDMIARFWPVRGVVGENGAFYYAYDSGARRMLRRYHEILEEQLRIPDRFARIKARISEEVPAAAISADQPFRLADLAVDFCEDVDPLSDAEVGRIKAIFEEEGATAKLSSIHVNGWFGNYDKLGMTRHFAEEVLGISIDDCNSDFVFVGDSPNDSPMFHFFRNSCGVANVRRFGDRLEAKPKWVANAEGAAGFREVVDHLLLSRRR